ncbi:hypothetical protein COCC4DRAFT_167958 [Bipolaris maydis ATCC 48331]|uniref:Uncharacterized protein n=2 Tax=Cochliobolus heterostrophus TaxID=5016 RepID=M2TQZ7_COCH5|nr:uncharacterized protein COCC4DRAFT_167958 [Bipolaris maydis ATCC 48331]EMD88959.1 hypothetical protein COCHEDRAFT_1182500 [Bipolaris maydis C5]ENI05323.1 hypothetical protein COCC4DRAFT_167958 [Bipolaris maydis ATCC 48331]KAJ6205877.1 hypothetical protein PSV09DRAFT_1182500 [Bipolaris maydis]
MRASNPYTTSYPSYEPRTPRPRRSASQSYRSHRRKESWPPPPSVEDEPEALAKEARSQPPSPAQRRDDGEPPVNTRGTIDQEYILDEIEQPSATQDPDATTRSSPHRDRQRRSFADRGPMPNINTDVPDPPLFTERERMPYGYSQPQKESTAPMPTDFLRSPEPMTPSDSRFATSDMGRADQDAQRHSHGKSPTPRPVSSRHNSLANSRQAEKDRDRSRPPSRYGRYETTPAPRPRGDVQSSLASGRPSSSHSALPYPMDDQLIDVLMPPEQNYQYNHSPIASPRQDYIEPPRSSSPTATSSPYIRDSQAQPSRQSIREEPGLSRRARSDSIRSQDGRRDKSLRRVASLDLKSLPDCPRSKASREYDDWYSLRGFKNFNICPDCYKSVFFETRFDGEFKQIWLDDWSIKRACDFSNPWPRLAWYLTVKQRLKSLDLLCAVADIMDTYKPCPGEREKDTNEASWYGIVNQRDGMFVPNFAICSSDRRLAEALFPSIRGYFPRITVGYSNAPSRYTCSFRMSSRRLMKYLELLMELDEDAQITGRRPDIDRFVDLARDYAFKGECARDKILIRKPWYFIPQLPEFTVCEECYDRFVWPAMQSKSLPTTIPRLFNKSIQLVPGEDPEAGSSCCLWSPRMRSVWMRSVEDEDFAYLKRKALERKKAQVANTRERGDILRGLGNAEPGDSKYEWAKRELDILDREWASYE